METALQSILFYLYVEHVGEIKLKATDFRADDKNPSKPYFKYL